MTQKELKEKYMEVICKEVWAEKHMQDYARKECAYVVQLSNGNIISIDKPKIQKDFCFGMGWYGTYTDDEFKMAEEEAEKARTDIIYFLDQNMQQITNIIDSLKECIDGTCECYTFTNYNGQPENSILKDYSIVGVFDNPDYNPQKWIHHKGLNRISKEDVQLIINGLEEVRKGFAKRLNTYLKKYGLEKLNIWTYCRD